MKTHIPIPIKLSKLEIKHIVQIILAWTFINVSFNIFGLWISKLLKEAEFTYFESIFNEFVKPLIIQSSLFGVCILVAFMFLKNKKLTYYIFVFVQFLIFHIIFLAHLKIHHGLHFASTFKDFGLQYLSYSGQYLIDILYLYFPIIGNFDNGLFLPNNIGTFYLHWILLNIIYYFAITWISIKFIKVFVNNNAEPASKI